jgi:membrane peptidoglycan carboxypeptidase
VLALAGETRDGDETPLSSPHPPGSLLDAFVYLTGFTTGMGPASLVWDVPPASDAPAAPGLYHGPMRLRTALSSDLPAPAAMVHTQVGAENAARTLRSFGLDPDGDLTSLQLAGAFGALGTQGVYFGQQNGDSFTPVTVLRVEALDGSVLLDWSIPQATPVVSAGLAYLMTDALSDEAARELALGRPNPTEIGRPAGVKLGLSADGRDAWTVGYTPQRVVVAWTHSRSSALARRVPAVLYAGLMQYVSRPLPADGWAAPADVATMTVCDPSGMLPTRDCPQLVSEVFLSGSEPSQADTLYRTFLINRETGYLATVFTPPALVEERVFLMVPPEAAQWALNEGLPLPPNAYDAIQAPTIDPDVNIASPALFDEVRGTVRISGTASGADFVAYRILAGEGINPQEWVEVTRSDMPVTNGVLGEWDTTGLSGLYALQLAVTRTDDRLDSAVTQVTVGAPLVE